jgi:hypothetical protein
MPSTYFTYMKLPQINSLPHLAPMHLSVTYSVFRRHALHPNCGEFCQFVVESALRMKCFSPSFISFLHLSFKDNAWFEMLRNRTVFSTENSLRSYVDVFRGVLLCM